MSEKPLNTAEDMLLRSFCQYLRDGDLRVYQIKCDLLEALVRAAKAKVKLELEDSGKGGSGEREQRCG